MSVWLKTSAWMLLITVGFIPMEGAILAQESSSATEDSEAFEFEGSKRPKFKRPNILFAISDDQSYPHASADGCNWVDTPAFDRVAKMGLLFNRCYTPNAKCAPSRACLVTGRYSWELEQAANHWCYFPSQFRSYVEVLGEFGYRT
ncbi:MAG: sulfatase-like hydrolase/transferase, partial [Planctomycetota bacterium]|nr:sulfatase-like hydrolase/transferase [Planctomycetota bacterium]